MADNWRILDFVEFQGGLSQKQGKLQIVDSKTGEVASEGLDDVSVILIGIGVDLAPALIHHLAKHDVVLLSCDWRGVPIAGLYPWIETHGRVAARQRAQADLSVPRVKNAWARIIKAKIRGQANVLLTLGRAKSAKEHKSLAALVQSGDPSNVEARAARLYWQALFPGQGFRRLPGEHTDSLNMKLDYGYMVLRGHSIRAIMSAGLSPTLGLFHRNRSNFFALADDLIEPFRPAVDFVVARLPAELTPEDPEVKRALVNASLMTIRSDGATVPTVMTDLAQQYGRYVEGNLKFLGVPIWNNFRE